MVRGFYTAGTGMIAQRKSMDVIMNNSVNVETAGYKNDAVISRSFKDRLIDRINDPSIINMTSEVGPMNGGVHVDELITTFEQGNIDGTGQTHDMALAGDGFFCIQTAQGERYTRAGNFNVDTQGYLCNADGQRVLGTDNNPLQVGFGDFTVAHNGQVTRADGQYAGQMKIVQFEDNTQLRKQGDNLFYNFGNTAMNAADATTTVRQGYLEMSNAEMADVMVDMMTVYRVYESNQKMVQMTDESIGIAVNQIGKVQ